MKSDDSINDYTVRIDATGELRPMQRAFSPLGLVQRFPGRDITIWNTDNGRIWISRDSGLKLIRDPDDRRKQARQ